MAPLLAPRQPSAPSSAALNASAQLQLDLFAAVQARLSRDARADHLSEHAALPRTSDGAAAQAVPLPQALPWPPSATPLEVCAPERSLPGGELTACVFDAYAPHVAVHGGKPHLTKLVESAAMAAASPPPCTYRPHLPQWVVSDGQLSEAQLEAVCYAGQAHGGHLPEGQRQGFFLGDGTGVGKGRAQPLDALVLTPTGWRPMGEVCVGDLVVSDDGHPTRVVGVYPQGRKAVYRVTFSDGTSTECTDDHLWLTQTKRQRYHEKHGMGVDYPKPDVRTTREIRESLHRCHSIPLVSPVHFEPQPTPVDPYLLGAMIGDGCIRTSNVQLALGDVEMAERVREALPAGVVLWKVPGRQYHYSVTRGTRKRGGLPRQCNPVLSGVRSLGLCGKRAWEKWVPEPYLFNAVEVRLAVLQGLMDTDGYVDRRGIVQHYTTSEGLAADVAFLVQSLGGVARRSVKRTVGRDCYVTTVTLPNGTCPFRLSRKAQRVRPKEKYPPRRFVEAVEYVGEKEAQCIAVDSPSRLYVTEHFIVTHNTSAAILLDNYLQGRRRALWVSENRSLLRDAQRDWTALGAPAGLLFELPDGDGPVRQGEGVLFVSYDTLKGKPRSGKGVDRLEQTVRWLCGGTEEHPGGVPAAAFDGVVVFDECFPYDTPVLTEAGWLPIGEVVERRLPLRVLSYDVERGRWTWRPIVKHRKNPYRGNLVRVVYEGGELVCTANHKVWTEEHGYVPAEALPRGAHVRLVPERLPHGEQGPERDGAVLRPDMRGAGDGRAASASGHGELQAVRKGVRDATQPEAGVLLYGVPRQQRRPEEDGRGGDVRLVRDPVRAGQAGVGPAVLLQVVCGQAHKHSPARPRGEAGALQADRARQPGAFAAVVLAPHAAVECGPGVPAEAGRGEPAASGHELHRPAGRARLHNGAAAVAGRGARALGAPGARRADGAGARPVREPAELVRGGHRAPGGEGRHRGGRPQPPHEALAVPRPEEGGRTGYARVVRVEVLERGGADRLVGLHGEGEAVYNLEVEEHHNYVAAGVLVSNCHNMASALDLKGERGVRRASQRALAGVELQRRLPDARVVYASATGATEVANLAYAERLGLWGRGTPFPAVGAFVEQVSNGGIAAMELVAKDLKAMGLYLARSVSYDGVEYRTLVHGLTEEQARTYDKLAEAWQLVLGRMEAALEVTKAAKSGAARAAAYSQFWGAHQRFFLHVLVAMAAPSLLRDVERRLGEGRSCVVQLVSTMEAATERAYARAVSSGEPLEDLDVTPRDQLLQFVQASFPTTQYEEYEDDDGRVRSRPVKDSNGNPVENPEAVAARERLMVEVGAVAVPHGVLDQLLDRFGPDAVAEVTGRSRRFVRRVVDGVERVVEERRSRTRCDADVDAFMAGKKRLLVFSQAGGTGRSYHADLSAENQERRVLYCVEPGWSSARCVQGMGRVHRANQAVPPELVLVTTDLKAQRRFLSTIARRLDQLGALTKGQRQTASQGLLSSEFNLETLLSRASLYNWFVDLYRGEVAGITLDLVQEQMGLRVLDAEGQLNQSAIPDVPKFLNRLLSLSTGAMDAVFDSWYRYLTDALEAAREAGKLDVGVETLAAERVVKTEERHVYTQPRTGAKTHVVTLELTKRTEITAWAEVWAKAREAQALGFFVGFVLNRRSEQVYALFRAGSRTTETGAIVARLRRVGVRSNRLFDEAELGLARSGGAGEGGGYQPLAPDEARRLWEDEVLAAPEFYTEAVHLVTGAVLPIWDRIAGHPRIYRVQTDEGERMIGRVVLSDHLGATLKALGAEGRKVEVTSEELAQKLLAGVEAELACGWVLRRRRVAGEPRIELVGPDLAALRELEADGVFCEVHQFRTRFFVPTGARAAGILARVTEHRPVVELRAPSGEDYEGSPPSRMAA